MGPAPMGPCAQGPKRRRLELSVIISCTSNSMPGDAVEIPFGGRRKPIRPKTLHLAMRQSGHSSIKPLIIQAIRQSGHLSIRPLVTKATRQSGQSSIKPVAIRPLVNKATRQSGYSSIAPTTTHVPGHAADDMWPTKSGRRQVADDI